MYVYGPSVCCVEGTIRSMESLVKIAFPFIFNIGTPGVTCNCVQANICSFLKIYSFLAVFRIVIIGRDMIDLQSNDVAFPLAHLSKEFYFLTIILNIYL